MADPTLFYNYGTPFPPHRARSKAVYFFLEALLGGQPPILQAPIPVPRPILPGTDWVSGANTEVRVAGSTDEFSFQLPSAATRAPDTNPDPPSQPFTRFLQDGKV